METKEQKPVKHAGGRKPLLPEQRKRAIGVRLAPWLAVWLDEQGAKGQNRAKLIEQAMAAQYNIKHD